MYNEYFGFKEAPFSIAPDPRYLYMTAQHRDALAHLVFGLNSEGGCILLTGEVGTGKTTICRCLLEQIPDQANVALVLNPKVNEIELLESICDELHISYPDSKNSLKTYTDRIYQFLIESNQRNEKTVLIIDEAQNLDSKVLEQLRLLTNLETNQRKLLQIIILGQPELLNILAQTEMRQLAQRITARFHLEPLSKHEVKAYINHRLAVAGQNIQLFPEKSVKLLYRFSKGVPRLINVICDRALLGAYVENQYTVTPSIIKKASIEVFGELKNVEQQQKIKRWLYPLAAFAGVAIITFFIAFFFYNIEKPDDTLQTAGIAAMENDSPIQEGLHDGNTTDAIVSTGSEANTQTSPDGQSAEDEPEHNAIDTLSSDSPKENFDEPTISDETLQAGTTLTETALAKTDEQTYDDIETILEKAPVDPAAAYQKLFKTWDHQYNSKTRTTACRQAEKLSLSCLFRHGNINSLKIHNRPANLTLINDRGEKRYITITSIDNDIATIYSNNAAYKIKLHDLDKYWYGQFILLWNKPEYYSSAILPGESGNVIHWLNLQLEKVNDSYSPDLIISKYDTYLIDKVKIFQTQQGLTADGIVGPVTIIHLNNKLGIEAPLLMSSPINTVMKEG